MQYGLGDFITCYSRRHRKRQYMLREKTAGRTVFVVMIGDRSWPTWAGSVGRIVIGVAAMVTVRQWMRICVESCLMLTAAVEMTSASG